MDAAAVAAHRHRRCLAWLGTALVLAVGGGVLPCGVAALYDDSDAPIVHITSSNFESEVIEYEGVVLLEGYAPWCGHCQKFAPEYIRVANKLRGIVKVAALDADAEPELAKGLGFQGFPTILGFPATPTRNPYTHKLYKTPKIFAGERTASVVARFATELLPSNVHVVTAANYAEFEKESGETPQVLLFTEKEQTTSLYKSLSTYFKDRLVFCQIHNSEEALAQKFSVEKFPSLLVVNAGKDKEPVRYDGVFSVDVLKEFLESVALPEKEKNGGPGQENKNSPDTEELLSSVLHYEDFTTLEKSIFEQQQGELPGPFILVLVTGDDQGKSCETYNTAASVIEKTAGMVKVGVAQGQLADQALKELKIKPKDCMSLVLFLYEEEEEQRTWLDGELYDGELSAKALQEAVLESVPDLTANLAGNVEMETWWFSDGFTAPKVMLFSKKEVTPPMYKALAFNMRNQKIRFGLIHAGVSEIIERFNIPKYPFVLSIFGPVAGGDPGALQVIPYSGPLNYESLSSWSQGVVQARAQMDGGEGSSFEEPEAAGSREVVRIDSDADLQTACLGQFSLCLLSFIDSDLEQKSVDTENQDSSQAMSRVDMELKYASESAKVPSTAIQIAVVDTPRQEKFSEAFGVTANDIPCAIIFNARKLRFARMLGSFTGKNIESFISDTLAGKISTSAVDSLPTLVAGGTARFELSNQNEQMADQAGEEVIEDEFSLDDIMGEDVGGGEFLSREQILRQDEEQGEERGDKKRKKSSKKSKKKSKKGSSKTEL